MTNCELFKSAGMRMPHEMHDPRRMVNSSLSRYESSNVTISNRGASLAFTDMPAGLYTTKAEERKQTLFSSKHKVLKTKAKGKHFKLLKKRNLNSKISKELRLTDLTKSSP